MTLICRLYDAHPDLYGNAGFLKKIELHDLRTFLRMNSKLNLVIYSDLQDMKSKKDSPGVFIPPPLFYVVMFLLSFILQGSFTIKRFYFFHSRTANILGLIIIITGLFFAVPALRQFFKSKTSIVPIKPASSLQTSGIYSVSRNPMYLGLVLQYLGLAFIFGNWWTLFLIPVLIGLIYYFVIRPEESYLLRAFGESYANYTKKVRRWI